MLKRQSRQSLSSELQHSTFVQAKENQCETETPCAAGVSQTKPTSLSQADLATADAAEVQRTPGTNSSLHLKLKELNKRQRRKLKELNKVFAEK